MENPFFIKSLVHQIRYLEKKIEYHLKGNHLLANAKALIFAGFYFEGKESDKWLKRMKILKRKSPSKYLMMEDILEEHHVSLNYSRGFTGFRKSVCF